MYRQGSAITENVWASKTLEYFTPSLRRKSLIFELYELFNYWSLYIGDTQSKYSADPLGSTATLTIVKTLILRPFQLKQNNNLQIAVKKTLINGLTFGLKLVLYQPFMYLPANVDRSVIKSYCIISNCHLLAHIYFTSRILLLNSN